MGDAVTGLKLTDPRASDEAGTPQTNAVVKLLDNVSQLIDEVEPQPTNQRFGNRAFRTFHYRLVEHAPNWIHDLLLRPFMRGEDGSLITGTSRMAPDDRIEIVMQDGEAAASVLSIHTRETR